MTSDPGPARRRVLVAMSGGVDSSVAAAILADQGHEVVGVTMKLWGGASDSGCCSVSDVDDARRAAQALGIDHHVFNFADDFQRHVVDPYVEDHRAGRTPNPCVACNRHIKFDKLFRRADALGFDLVATGHHARLVADGHGARLVADGHGARLVADGHGARLVADGHGARLVADGPSSPDGEPVWRIGRAADGAKDQSYVLHMLDQRQLRRLVLPIGGLTKAEVRARAAELGLVTAAKPDSQDVCFIHSGTGRRTFLGSRIPLAPARLVDTAGRQVGEVASVELVTIGQRRGLHLGGDAERRYVVDIDRAAGVVTVGRQHELLISHQSLDDVAWSHEPEPGPLRFQCSAHGQPRGGFLEPDDGDPRRATITWEEPQPRVAPGQSVAFYRAGGRDEVVVGGGLAGAGAVRDGS
ncbi:MAG: asparagine synthase-related protein [Acidimicrobiia bacterium]|nr:asparagine synthase-related protein [Acidimicrobiia bacterium]